MWETWLDGWDLDEGQVRELGRNGWVDGWMDGWMDG